MSNPIFDFLCIMPHATGANSLPRYINDHPKIFTFIDGQDSLNCANAFRECGLFVGASFQRWFEDGIRRAYIQSSARRLLIQTVRDPIECLVAQINRSLFQDRLNHLLERPTTTMSVDEWIEWGLKAHLRHHAVHVACEATTFDECVIVDISETIGDRATETLNTLWEKITGESRDSFPVGKSFAPLGSRSFYYLSREIMTFNSVYGVDDIQLRAIPGGQTVLGQHLHSGKYHDFSEAVRSYPRCADVLPSLKIDADLKICASVGTWSQISPKIRGSVMDTLVNRFLEHLKKFNDCFGAAELAMTFGLEQFTQRQCERLRVELDEDFRKFSAIRPEIVRNWRATRDFLDI